MTHNSLKEYGKVVGYFLFIIIILIPNFSFANQCSKDGYTVLTLNGVLTNDSGAKENSENLKKVLPTAQNNQKIKIDYLLNPSHMGGALDFAQAFAQGFFHAQSDYDLVEMMKDASNKITTEKVLLVGHSQGNFYANDFYAKVAGKDGGIPKESIRVYAVGTPANNVAGRFTLSKTDYITSDTDKAIAGVAGTVFNILPANIHIDLQPDDDFWGHDFAKVYLKYKANEIVANIQSSLDKLKTNNIQNENTPCMNPPAITLMHKIEGVALLFADHPVDTTLSGADFVATGAYNTSLAIGNTTINIATTITSSISSLAQSIFSNPKNLAVNNTATVIDAEDQSTDTPQNTAQNNAPEPTNIPASPARVVLAGSEKKTEALLPSTPIMEATSSFNSAEARLPQTTQDSTSTTTEETPPYNPSIISPSVVRQDLVTTPPSAPLLNQGGDKGGLSSTNSNTSTATQNLYPNLLPGGGGRPAAELPAAEIDENEANPDESSATDSTQDNVGTETPTCVSPKVLNGTGDVCVDPVIEDTTPPVITILGNNPETIEVGNAYTDAGATALDDVDGDITANVVIVNPVDVNTIADYTITYNVKDAAKNPATQVARLVHVVAPPPPPLLTVTIDKNTTLSPGEYNYDNLIITNNAILTLEGDPLSSNSFKGVKIFAVNLTIDPGSSISADQKGYGSNQGPGVSAEDSIGASYGGISRGGSATSIYGSVTHPTDLGSGGYDFGGGAIRLIVSDTFTDNGIVSSNANLSGSGGSVYVTAKNMAGNGILRANGGGLLASGYFKSPGGGGRIALYYETSSFSGTTEAKGGCGSYDGWSKVCATDGTIGFFETINNNLYVNNYWQFRQADAPFSFNNIYISNGAKAVSEDNVKITAKNIILNKNSSFTLADNQILNIPTITIDGGSTLTLSGKENITVDTLTIIGNSIVTIIPERILSLTIPNLNIEIGSSISADAKGYGPNQGPGVSAEDSIGASYGGISRGGSATSIYGSVTHPTDLGSGGYDFGGGAIRLIVSDTFTDNGIVSSNANLSGSGGSVYVTAKNMAGNGILRANGGGLLASGYFKSPGGGGRIALYYETSSFSGTTEAKGGCGSYDGWSKVCAKNGTVGLFDTVNNNLLVDTFWAFQKNDSPFNLNHIVLTGAEVLINDGAEITANDIVLKKSSILTLSGSEIINADSFLVTDNSTVTVVPEQILYLKIPNITVNSGSVISADTKGYVVGPGSPDAFYEAGASYGGKGGGITAKPSYGSEMAPTDFGSGTESRRGGGAIRLIVDNNLQNDGIISVNGNGDRVSGGSIYITANKINGNGAFQAKGGDSGWSYGSIGGAGGRIAIYYQTSNFSGTTNVLGGTYCFYGCAPAAEAGTVKMIDTSIPPSPAPDDVATQLKIITSPQTISADTASDVITVESQNKSGVSIKVASTTHVNLSSSSATGLFASSPASGPCNGDWTKIQITISTGDAHRSFCYKDNMSGTPVITISADGLSSDSQVLIVN